MSSTTAKVYLQLWLSEQIPIGEWKRILEERKDVKELYEKHYNFKVDENKTGDLQTILNHYGEWIHLPSQKEFLQGKYSNQIDKRQYIDFYGKFETLQQDFDYVCGKIGLPKTKLLHQNKSENEKDLNYERKLF